MANIARQGRGVNVVWGSDSANVSGLVTSARVVHTSERIPVLDNNGVPVGTIYVPQYDECEYEVLIESNTSVPNIGANITVGTQIAQVENVEEAWEQKGIKKLRVRGAALPA